MCVPALGIPKPLFPLTLLDLKIEIKKPCHASLLRQERVDSAFPSNMEGKREKRGRKYELAFYKIISLGNIEYPVLSWVSTVYSNISKALRSPVMGKCVYIYLKQRLQNLY